MSTAVKKRSEWVEGQTVASGITWLNEGFYIRPKIDGKRTWWRLGATKLQLAIEERDDLMAKHRAALRSGQVSPFARKRLFAEVADEFVAAGCPNKKMEARRGGDHERNHKLRLIRLKGFFGEMPLEQITIGKFVEYKDWRLAQPNKRGAKPGLATVRDDKAVLSSVLNWAVVKGYLQTNLIRTGGPTYYEADKIRHCRDFMPRRNEDEKAHGDVVHQVANYFFEEGGQMQLLGWMMLFSCLTGCRHDELRTLRRDGRNTDTPGFRDGNKLFIHRRKGGINPHLHLEEGGPLDRCVRAFFRWHQETYGQETVWWFPMKKDLSRPLHESSFGAALHRACQELQLPRIIPHGCRGFYVTKRRDDGISDERIAAEIGDKCGARIIAQTYGAPPDSWNSDAAPLSFLPSQGAPAWARFAPDEERIVPMANPLSAENLQAAALLLGFDPVRLKELVTAGQPRMSEATA